MALDFSTIPAPTVLEEPDLAVIETRDIEFFKELDPTYAYFLKSDPVTKVLRHGSWRELILRLYINKVARSRLIAFAAEGDLEHLALSEGVTRVLVDSGDPDSEPPIPAVYEPDDRLRDRLFATIAGRNGAGSEAYYRAIALKADARVRDVNIYSPDFPDGYNMGGRVSVAVLSYESTGVPSIDLLEKVNFALQQPNVKVVSDLIQAEAARPVLVTIQATIILKQTTPIDVFNQLSAIITDAFDNQLALGQDITLGWIIKTLAIDGVHDVIIKAPLASIKVSPFQFPSLHNLVLTFGGFDKVDDYRLSDAEKTSIYDRVYRYYYDSCVRYKRSAFDIAADLNKEAREGIIQPTTVGFATWLGIGNLIVNQTTNVVLPEDEIAFLIFEVLQPAYNAIT